MAGKYKIVLNILKMFKRMLLLIRESISKCPAQLRYIYDRINFAGGEVRNDPIFFFNRSVSHSIMPLLDLSKARSDAERICKKEFACLGLHENSVDRDIAWNKDYRAGYSWRNYYYVWIKHIKYNDPLKQRLGYDRKLPYEISRFQHLVPLSNAFVLFDEQQYAEEAVGQIEDWIDQNRFMYGINWTCAMEVAIRACNWIWVWWVLKDDPVWTETFNKKFIKSMWQHGWYIEHHLENSNGVITNHYLSDIVGLLFIGIMFPQFKKSNLWKRFSIDELIRCMREMVFSDGVHYENSTAYHRLVLEMFTYSGILCLRNGIDLPQNYWGHIEKMMEFIMYCTRPDGLMPMVGDNDDGRFFIVSNYYDWDRWDHRYLLSVAYGLFERIEFQEASEELWDEAIWILGGMSLQKGCLNKGT